MDEKFRRDHRACRGQRTRQPIRDLGSRTGHARDRNARGQLATASTRADSAERLAAELPDLRASRERWRAELATLKANARISRSRSACCWKRRKR
jgi:hypothetical protein